MKDLTISQLVLLLSIWRLGANAYGVTIRKNLVDLIGKKYPFGTLYSLLDQLYKKGYVEKQIGPPTNKRGGRRTILYSLSPEGQNALKAARKLQKIIWDGISEAAFDRK